MKNTNKKTRKIKIFLADDHTLVRENLVDSLLEEADFAVVGQTGYGQDVVKLVKESSPDILLLDIDMPGLSGVEALELLQKESPQVKIIMLTGYSDDSYKVRSLLAGARAYIQKGEDRKKLFNTIRSVYLSQDNSLTDALKRKVDQFPGYPLKESLTYGLTPSEIEILDTLKEGTDSKEAAKKLKISVRTFESHLTHIYSKLGVSNKIQAIRRAHQLKIISLD